MRIRMSGNNNKQTALNITVRVEGFVEEGDQVSVAGINVLTGQKMYIWLTVKGVRADNENRESIKKLRDGIKFGRDQIRILEAGGLVSFKSAFPKSDGSDHYWSTWANVLAYNTADAEKYVAYGKTAILTMHPAKEGRAPWGKLTIYTSDSERHIVGVTPDDLYDGVGTYSANNRYPTFLVRYLDANNAVIGFSSFWRTFIKDDENPKGRELSPAEIASFLVEDVTNNLRNYAACSSINVLPGRRYTVSPRQLTSGDPKENKLKNWLGTAEYFYKRTACGDDVYFDYYCKELFAKLGGENSEFVNGIQVVNPKKDAYGVDPVLIGGLEYSAKLLSDMAVGNEDQQDNDQPHDEGTEQSEESAGQHQPSPVPTQDTRPLQNNEQKTPEPPVAKPPQEETKVQTSETTPPQPESEQGGEMFNQFEHEQPFEKDPFLSLTDEESDVAESNTAHNQGNDHPFQFDDGFTGRF